VTGFLSDLNEDLHVKVVQGMGGGCDKCLGYTSTSLRQGSEPGGAKVQKQPQFHLKFAAFSATN
jgi:hypothetical protein